MFSDINRLEERVFEEKDQNDEFWILMGPFFGKSEFQRNFHIFKLVRDKRGFS